MIPVAILSRDPYTGELSDPGAPFVPPPRRMMLSIPAKDAHVGLRSSNAPWYTPATCTGFDGRFVFFLTSASDLHPRGAPLAMALSDPWEWKPATEVHFADPCGECQGIGEKPIAGPGSAIGWCLRCDGYGEIAFDPWRNSRRRRRV